MATINFEGMSSNLLSGAMFHTSHSTVMFSVSGNSQKEIYAAANRHAEQHGIHDISSRSSSFRSGTE